METTADFVYLWYVVDEINRGKISLDKSPVVLVLLVQRVEVHLWTVMNSSFMAMM